jgi:uncharacterized protein (DUF58 family)
MLANILKNIRLIDLKTKNKITSLFAGNYCSNFKGQGIEFADIRPYDTNDNIRDIDWKTSSKQGELFVKTYHESRDNNIFFLINISTSFLFRSTPKLKYETLLETFAILAFSAIKNGNRVGALIYGNGKTKIFPNKKHRKNILNIITYCLEQYTIKNQPSTSISKAEIFHLTQKSLKHSSTIFWLTDDLELDKNSSKKIKLLKHKHDFIPLIINDPLENNWQQTGHFILQNSQTTKIQNLFINKEIVKIFHKIRLQKQQNFTNFFQKNQMNFLFITTTDNLFFKLFQFFKFKKNQ